MSSFSWHLYMETCITFFPTVSSGVTFPYGTESEKCPFWDAVKAAAGRFSRKKQYNYWRDDKSPDFSKVTDTGSAFISLLKPLWNGAFRISPPKPPSKTKNQPANLRYRVSMFCCHRQGLFRYIQVNLFTAFFFFSSSYVGAQYKKRRKKLFEVCTCVHLSAHTWGRCGVWFP